MPDLFIPTTNPTPQSTQTPTPIVVGKKGSSFHLFSAFNQMPRGMHFQSQTDDETIQLFLRRHFITNVPWIVATLILLIFPPLLVQLFSTVGSPIDLPENLALVLLSLYYLALFAYALVNFMTWFYNITIVSDKRIVDIDYSEIVYQNVAQTKLTLVEDVSYTQTGFIRSLFNYGDVFAQTAGEMENIDALAVPKPQLAVQIIADRIGEGGQIGG